MKTHDSGIIKRVMLLFMLCGCCMLLSMTMQVSAAPQKDGKTKKSAISIENRKLYKGSITEKQQDIYYQFDTEYTTELQFGMVSDEPFAVTLYSPKGEKLVYVQQSWVSGQDIRDMEGECPEGSDKDYFYQYLKDPGTYIIKISGKATSQYGKCTGDFTIYTVQELEYECRTVSKVYTGRAQSFPKIKIVDMNGKTVKIPGSKCKWTRNILFQDYKDKSFVGLKKAKKMGAYDLIFEYNNKIYPNACAFLITPKQAKIKSIKKGEDGSITLKINKGKGSTKTEIEISDNKKFSTFGFHCYYTTKGSKKKITGLQKGKTYYIRVTSVREYSDYLEGGLEIEGAVSPPYGKAVTVKL